LLDFSARGQRYSVVGLALTLSRADTREVYTIDELEDLYSIELTQ